MIEETCPTCGGKVLKPDPLESIKDIDERFQFERDWDRRYNERREQ